MVRSFAVRIRFGIASAAVVGTLWGGIRPAAQAPAVDPVRAIDAVMARAADLKPGGYLVTEAGAAGEPSARPVVIQADVLRGEGQTIRAAIVLGGETPQPYSARIRVLTAVPAGAAPQVVGEATAVGPAGTIRLVREFTLPPGEYDVYAAIGHRRDAAGAILSVQNARLVVPDVWRGPLAVTPVVLGDSVGVAARAPGARPFEFEPTSLTPATTDRFQQGSRVHAAFRIYNWTADPRARPDLVVEYVFHQRGLRGARFFNKMKPQRVNADSVGAAFDPADAVVTAGVTVPLVSFPFGEFELTVRVTDNRSKQSAERRVRFAVAP